MQIIRTKPDTKLAVLVAGLREMLPRAHVKSLKNVILKKSELIFSATVAVEVHMLKMFTVVKKALATEERIAPKKMKGLDRNEFVERTRDTRAMKNSAVLQERLNRFRTKKNRLTVRSNELSFDN